MVRGASVVSPSPCLRTMFDDLSRRRSSGGRRLCRCWCCLRHYSITTMIARLVITAGLSRSPFGLLIASLGVIITNPSRLRRTICHSVPFLVTLMTPHHAVLVLILGRLKADSALPSHDPVNYRLFHGVVVHRFGGCSVRHMVEMARSSIRPGWSAVSGISTATSLLLLLLCPPTLVVG